MYWSVTMCQAWVLRMWSKPFPLGACCLGAGALMPSSMHMQWFSARPVWVAPPPQEASGKSENVCHWHNLEGWEVVSWASCWVEARDATPRPAVHRTALSAKNHTSDPRVSSVRVEKPRDRVLIAIFKAASVVLESSVPGTARWWRRCTFSSLVVWFRGLNWVLRTGKGRRGQPHWAEGVVWAAPGGGGRSPWGTEGCCHYGEKLREVSQEKEGVE